MSIRTDLAVECFDAEARTLPKGMKRRIRKSSSCTITEIIIEDEIAGRRIGKTRGRYITVETNRLSAHPDDFSEQAEDISAEISALMGEPNKLLVIGLGNRDITPDALGPMTVSGVISTRHIVNISGLPKTNNVAAVAPGVLGQTGIESAEIAYALCDTVHPDCVIAVDALACSDISRLGTTIQITDTGISPGSGVQNRRRELSRATLGVPVIAVGVPTVIDMHTIVENITGSQPEKHLPNMMVTPRDVDELIRRTSKLLAFSINKCAQRGLTEPEIISLM
ncbi:MAG: GPR endopeptidase [Oscillospiraceae bacterium]|nr:GPR endopeptidase [Oscillospiraceae bacterium]